MVDPVPAILDPIKRGILNVNIRITGIKVDISNPRNLARQRIRNVHRLKERRSDQVHVLARVGKETHHGEGHKRAHRAAVVVARQTIGSGAEELGDVIMRTLGGESRSSGVMVLKHREEGRLVADVRNVLVVEIVQAVDEAVWTSVETDQRCLVMGHVEAVFPDGGLECLWAVVLQGADAEVVVVGAVQRVLIAPGAVEIARFEKPREAGVGAVPPERSLVFFVEIAPVTARKGVLLLIGCPARGLGHFGDAEVVVGVFERTGDRSCQGAEAFPVKILDGNVTERMPAVETAASLAAPVEWLNLGVFDNSGVAILPLR